MSDARYLVFFGPRFYAAGGASNLIGAFDTINECWNAVDEASKREDFLDEWCHAFDLKDIKPIMREGWESTGWGDTTSQCKDYERWNENE